MKLAILDALQKIYWQDDHGYTDGEKFRDMLAPLMPEARFDIFYVAEGQWPADIGSFDGILASGSAASIHNDLAWIHQLRDLLSLASKQKKKIIGTCFSHQLIASLHGGEVNKNENGWLIGNYELQIERRYAWMQPGASKTVIHHFNQERVTRLPEAANSFASSQHYRDHAYTIDNHILCVQGHPEQSTQSISNWLEASQGLLTEAELIHARSKIEGTEPDSGLWASWFAAFLRT